MHEMLKNNFVTLSGTVVNKYEFDHEVYGESFYRFDLEVNRHSENCDVIKIMVSDRLIDVSEDASGKMVMIRGQYRSYNKLEGDKKKLLLYVFALEFEYLDDTVKLPCVNEIYLEGYICKEPIYRKTPFGREICDLSIAVNRPYGKSDYIPVIAWGRTALFSSELPVGAKVSLCGRIQSRDYSKKVDEDTFEIRTAYEVSVSTLGVLEYE